MQPTAQAVGKRVKQANPSGQEDEFSRTRTFQPLQSPRLLALTVGYLIIGVILGIGLLRMKNWSRLLAIIVSATQLLFVPHEVAVGHSRVAAIRAALHTLFGIWVGHSSLVVILAGLHTLFCIWIIWYLTRPNVKRAFQST
jgi:uncharacterized membrane protein (DUF2068 family)